MRVGVKMSTSPHLSVQHQESTMSKQWKNYPSILQTLGNNHLHQSIMKHNHIKDTEIATPHATN